MIKEEKTMGITDRDKGNAYCIVLFATILFLILIAWHPAYIYATDNKLIIDPESISGGNDKEGNVLAEYGFVVFTEESMSNMREIKNKKEKDQIQMVAGLFGNKWKGSTNYDKEVKAVIKSGNLFEKVDTGIETKGDPGMNPHGTRKLSRIIIVAVLMSIMSLVVIRWNRKKYENNHNIRTK